MCHARHLAPFVTDKVLSASPTKLTQPEHLKLEDSRSGTRVCIAQSDQHLCAASHLVEQRYGWRGYAAGANLETEPTEQRAQMITLIAEHENRAAGTLSVRFDSSQGLSVDQTFKAEVDAVRAKGGFACEFTRLAVAADTPSSAVLALLIRLAFLASRGLKAATDAVVEVNPRHERFYRRILDFNVISSHRICPRVQAPAVLLHLDLCGLEHSLKRLGHFYTNAMPIAA